MAYALKRGLIVPQRKIINPRRIVQRVSRQNIISFRRPYFPIANPALAAVAFDATSTSATILAAAASPQTHGNLTVGTGSNRVLLVGLYFSALTPSVSSVVWDAAGANQAMTLIKEQNTGVNFGDALLYGLVAPASGNKLVTVTWAGGASDISIAGVSFTGADQTGGATTFNNAAAATGNSTTSTITITTGTTDAVVAVHCNEGFGVGTGPNNIVIWSDATLTGGNGANYEVNGATATMTDNWSGTDNWAVVGTNIKASGAVSSDTPRGFVGRTFPRKWDTNALLLRNTAQDFSSSAVETNPHFKTRTFPLQWLLTKSLIRQNIAADTSSSAVETNPHWVGKKFPVQWSLYRQLWSNPAVDAPAVVVQPETNTFFVPRTFPPQWRILPLLKQGTAQDFSSSAVETNPHWRGRTWPLRWDAVKFQLQGTAQDFSAPAIETNQFFRPFTWPAQWNLQPSLLRSLDFSSTTTGITTTFIMSTSSSRLMSPGHVT